MVLNSTSPTGKMMCSSAIWQVPPDWKQPHLAPCN